LAGLMAHELRFCGSQVNDRKVSSTGHDYLTPKPLSLHHS